VKNYQLHIQLKTERK